MQRGGNPTVKTVGLVDPRKEFLDKILLKFQHKMKGRDKASMNSIQHFCLIEIVLQVLILNHT